MITVLKDIQLKNHENSRKGLFSTAETTECFEGKIAFKDFKPLHFAKLNL